MRWVIGDIHGMYAPLSGLLEAVGRADATARFYFVGDYVNRGHDSRRVIELLLSLENAHFVRGNHDDVFDQVLHGTSYGGEGGEAHRLAAFQWFMQHGLDQTFLSYGADAGELQQVLRRPTIGGLQRLGESVPEAHRRFIRELPAVIEEPDLFIMHARWDPDAPTDALAARAGASHRTRYGVLWGRFTAAEIERKKRWRRRGFFGHTPVFNYTEDDDDDDAGAGDEAAVRPIVRDDMVLLDTAVALMPTGRLTAVCAETGQMIQVDRSGAVVTKS